MPKTRQHRDLKELAARIGVEEGWTARFDVSETTKNGTCWIADVLLERGQRRVAVEVQWSAQSHQAYLDRQKTYRESGLEVVWMHRTRKLQPSAAVMEGRVSELQDGGYSVHLEGHPGQTLSAGDFVQAALNERLRFGFEATDPVNVYVMEAEADCWHNRCNHTYKIIPILSVTIGNPKYTDPYDTSINIRLSDIGRYPVAKERLMEVLNDLGGWDHVQERYSHTRSESYLSCGCPKCDRILGDHYSIHYVYDTKPVAEYRATMETLFSDHRFYGPNAREIWIAW